MDWAIVAQGVFSAKHRPRPTDLLSRSGDHAGPPWPAALALSVRRFLLLCASILVILGVTWTIAAPAAWSVNCQVLDPHHFVDGSATRAVDTGNVQGMRSTVHVNDFTDNPHCTPVRPIAVQENANNYVEFGWRKDDGLPPVVFWRREEDGVGHQHDTDRHPAQGSEHTFKVVNANGDHDWEVVYDGSSINNTLHQNRGAMYRVITNTEQVYAGDVMWAHYYGIQLCTSGCNFRNPDFFESWYDTADNWQYCRVPGSNTEHYVKQAGGC